MNGIIFKTIAARFYAINTGFFLVSFLLLFGLLNGKATMELHYYLMQRITDSYLFTAGAMVVWLLYLFKCLAFTLKEIKKPANSFLFALQSMRNGPHLLLWLSSFLSTMAPLLLYGSITVFVGLGKGNYPLTLLFAFWQLALCLVSAKIAMSAINLPWKKPFIVIPELAAISKKNLYALLLHYSLSKRKRTFVGVKLLSVLILQAMVMANANEINKESVCVLIMFLVAAHSLLPYYYVRFIEEDMSFLRNLPIRSVKIFLLYLLTYSIIFIPELLFVILNSNHSLTYEVALALYAIAVAQTMLYTAIQYLPNMLPEKYTMIVFALFFASLLLLASFYLWTLFAAEIVLATIMFLVLHSRYERLQAV